METRVPLLKLYEAIISDCNKLIEKNVEEKDAKYIKEKLSPDIKKLINFYKSMLQNSNKIGSIRTYSLSYLDGMLKDIENNKSDDITENEICSAYGYLFSFCNINQLCEEDEITQFELKNYPNFAGVIKRQYGDYDLLKENYENNVKNNLNGDKKDIKKLFQLLEKKKLIQKKTEITGQKKKRKKDKIKNSQKNTDRSQNSNANNAQNKEDNKKPNMMIKYPDKDENKNIREEKKSIDLKIEADENTKKEKNTINTKEINNITKNEKNNDVNRIKEFSNTGDNNIMQEYINDSHSVKERTGQNNLDENNIMEMPDMSKKNDDIKNVENLIDSESKKEIDEKVVNETNKTQHENKEINLAELAKIVTSLQKELDKTKTKLVNTELELNKTKAKLDNTELELSTRINNLENNQTLMFYQISMYQSRDISKSIYFFFTQYLNIKNEPKPFFDLKNIMQYLKGDDVTKFSQKEKKILSKFFKSLFFVNKVNNKILHRNMDSITQKAINDMKNNDLLSLIPLSNYNQLFDSLAFYVENNIKNNQVQEVMKYVYNSEYINDNGLGKIKDEEKEAIEMDENEKCVRMLITKDEINSAKELFSKINGFAHDCDIKTWDN